jgi:hypothetical protein
MTWHSIISKDKTYIGNVSLDTTAKTEMSELILHDKCKLECLIRMTCVGRLGDKNEISNEGV